MPILRRLAVGLIVVMVAALSLPAITAAAAYNCMQIAIQVEGRLISPSDTVLLDRGQQVVIGAVVKDNCTITNTPRVLSVALTAEGPYTSGEVFLDPYLVTMTDMVPQNGWVVWPTPPFLTPQGGVSNSFLETGAGRGRLSFSLQRQAAATPQVNRGVFARLVVDELVNGKVVRELNSVVVYGRVQ